MADSYVCSGAIMKCTMGTSQARLTVLPSRTVFLTGQPQANISDHISFVNLGAFGRCRSMGFPATASATAANHGTLTPMPCMHNTPFPWMGGKNDYIIKGQPALLKSSTCQCMWGGTISLITDGQTPTGSTDLSRVPREDSPRGQKYNKLALINLGSNAIGTDGFNHSELEETEGAKSQSSQGTEKKFSPLTEAENHLKILKSLKQEDLKGFPSSWSKIWSDTAKNVNSKYAKEGIKSVYSDVEHLYNMYQLFKSEDARSLGYKNISDKMPYQVFEIGNKVSGFLDRMPPKNFWDSFDTFVPLYTNTGEGAYFSPDYKYVVIPMHIEKSVNRMNDSEWYQSGRFYHEYGHAYDNMKGWRNDQEFIDVFNDFKAEISKSDVKTKMQEYVKVKGGYSKMTKDELEKMGSLSDSLQAAIAGHDPVPPAGHSKEYYQSEDKQMAEFIAHMSENYWGGNDVFESLAPESYVKMHNLIEKRWN